MSFAYLKVVLKSDTFIMAAGNPLVLYIFIALILLVLMLIVDGIRKWCDVDRIPMLVNAWVVFTIFIALLFKVWEKLFPPDSVGDPPKPDNPSKPPVDPPKPDNPSKPPADPPNPDNPSKPPVDPQKPDNPPKPPVDPSKPDNPSKPPVDPSKPDNPTKPPVDPPKPTCQLCNYAH